MHRKLRGRRVDTELHVFEALSHGRFGGGTLEEAELAAEVRRFEKRQLRRATIP